MNPRHRSPLRQGKSSTQSPAAGSRGAAISKGGERISCAGRSLLLLLYLTVSSKVALHIRDTHSRRRNSSSQPSQGMEKPQCLSACLKESRKSNPQGAGGCQAAGIINIQAELQTAAGQRFPARVAQARLSDRAQSPRRISELPLGSAAPVLAASGRALVCIEQTPRHSQSQLQEYSPRVSKAM